MYEIDNYPVRSSGTYAKVGPEGVNEILGKILTFADMAFSDPQQRKAFKDNIKQSVWLWWHNYPTYDGNVEEAEEAGPTPSLAGRR